MLYIYLYYILAFSTRRGFSLKGKETVSSIQLLISSVKRYQWYPLYTFLIQPVSVTLESSCGQLNKTTSHLQNKLPVDRYYHYTLLHRTGYKTVPSQQGLSPGVFLQLWNCEGSKQSNFMGDCEGHFDVPVSQDNNLKRFLWRYFWTHCNIIWCFCCEEMSRLLSFKRRNLLPEICTTVKILFLKKSIKMKQSTSSLAIKRFVRFLPYMGLDNKNLLYYTILGTHEQQQQNNSNNLSLLYSGYVSGLHWRIVDICK
jgi:hypothetical protein